MGPKVYVSHDLGVGNFMDDNGSCIAIQAYQALLHHIENQVLRYLLPRWCRPGDSLVWSLDKKCVFIEKSAYLKFSDSKDLGLPTIDWNVIRKLPNIPRITFFLWQLLQNCLLTKTRRIAKILSQNTFCTRCPCDKETSLHVLSDCTEFSLFWLACL